MRNPINTKTISRWNFIKLIPVLFAAAYVGRPSIEKIQKEDSKYRAIQMAAEHYRKMSKGGLYNNSNPNISREVTQSYTYRKSLRTNVPPGVSYDSRFSSCLVHSIAPGVLLRIRTLPYRHHREGGKQIEIAHGHGKPQWSELPGVPEPSFVSYYSHIDKVSDQLNFLIKEYRRKSNGKKYVKIPRGFLLGEGFHTKIMLRKGPTWEDPDNYGVLSNYGEEGFRNYMTYEEDLPDNSDVTDRKIIDNKWNNQMKCVFDMYNALKIFDWGNWHKKSGPPRERAAWSIIEEGRFLIDFAYPNFPHLFDISKIGIQRYKKQIPK